MNDKVLAVLRHAKKYDTWEAVGPNEMLILANAMEDLFDPTPLSIDVLRRELGEPTFASNLVTQWGEHEDKSQVSLRRSGNVFVRGQRVLTAGQLRRILSVIRETAAGGEG